MSDYRVDEGAQNLTKLRNKIISNTAAKAREPEFLAVLTGKSDAAYRRKDGVYIIPITTLAP